MTVCALAIDMAATKARSVRRAYMVEDVRVPAARMKTADEDYVGVDQVEDQKRRAAEMLRSRRADRSGYAGLVAHSE